MKKVLFIACAALLSLVACTNDMNDIAPADNVTIIKATLDDNAASRTNFTSAGKFFWTTGDLIKVYNTNGGFSEFQVIEGAGTGSATFSGVMSGQSSTCAVYPSAAAGSVSGTKLTITMPSTYWYIYAQSDFASVMEPDLNSINVPMVAKIGTVGSTNFNFKNLSGVFCFKFKDVPANTAKIVFTANSKISGDFTVNLTEETPIISTSEVINPAYKSVAVAFTPSSSKTDRVVYFPVPCGTYNGFRIEMYDEADKKTAFMSSDKSKTVDRSKALVYNEITVTTITGGIEGQDTSSNMINGHEYVDLGLPSGLKWATCNIGAESVYSYSCNFYYWGDITPKIDNSQACPWHCVSNEELQALGVIDTNLNLTLSHDIASIDWGGSWRTPTIDETKELINNCSWSWVTVNECNGFKGVGPNGKEIFIPAAGSLDPGFTEPKPGNYGSFWTSTISYQWSWALYFGAYSDGSVDSAPRTSEPYRDGGRAIRPVTE